MRPGWHTQLITKTMLLAVVAGTNARAADNSNNPRMTIGGVIYTDVKDPMRTGLPGVTVKVHGDKGDYEAVTGGLIGLWKMDVPQGTYVVTPGKPGYLMQHLVAGWCDDQRAITIEVNRKNLAANQSIQFLAVHWPEPNTPIAASPAAGPNTPAAASAPPAAPNMPAASTPAPAPVRGTERTGGGCATARGRQSTAADFFAPYTACFCLLLVTRRVDTRRRRRRRW